MARLFSILIMFLLVVSHGTMAEAAPHFDGRGQAVEHPDHGFGGHDHDAPAQGDDSGGLPSAMHVHCAADVAPEPTMAIPGTAGTRAPAARIETALASREEAPPIRPPAA